MEPIRYAAIGVAGIAGAHFNDLAKRPGVEIVGLVDTNADNLAKARERFPDAVAGGDAAAVLAKAKPNFVSVCTPNKFHHPMTMLALRHGAHVACEKPMAMTLAEAREMEAARKQAGVLGYINFSYRNVPSFRFARELIRRGELGRIQRIHALYLQGWIGASDSGFGWRNDRDLAGYGALGDLGVHMIDAVRFITGREVESVVGQAVTRRSELPDAAGTLRKATTDDNASFLAQMDDGALAVFDTSQTSAGYTNHHRIEVCGEKGTLICLTDRGSEIGYYVGDTLTRFSTWNGEIPWLRVPTGFVAKHGGEGVATAVDAIRGLTDDYPSFADGVAAQAVVEAIDRSMADRRWIAPADL